ncbi:hypothetical protein GCM10009409_33620 [Shewanella saliphila]|uniref:Uncharacterized protein n=1 Tax=Shewanella saliphila TaxID=2282698 RepID=A0ABQ2QAV7_9GAMM|nr:hypothetical protein GCM10009409_33620 [Shewanella saliphila]
MVAGAGLDKKLRPSTIVYEKLSPTSYQLLHPATDFDYVYLYFLKFKKMVAEQDLIKKLRPSALFIKS